MRCVMTRVLPLPAPARTRIGPSVCSTAWRCRGFRPSRKSIARPILTVRTRRASFLRSDRPWPSESDSEKPKIGKTDHYRLYEDDDEPEESRPPAQAVESGKRDRAVCLLFRFLKKGKIRLTRFFKIPWQSDMLVT